MLSLTPSLSSRPEWAFEGAAIATVLARIAIFGGGLYWLLARHKLVARPSLDRLLPDIPKICFIALPAILTNAASPVGGAFVTVFISGYGNESVAAWAVINRLIPVSFGGLFALSGAVGPIIGQNLGAEKFGRLRQTVRDAMQFVLYYMLVVWLLLAIGSGPISDLFRLEGQARELVIFFCIWVVPFFGFWGLIFVANAAFNNLGKPHFSMVSNWGRATLGTLPFVYVGSLYFGANGIIAGYIFGSMGFGLAAIYVCFRLIGRIEARELYHG